MGVAAVLAPCGSQAPLLAQEGDGESATIRLSGLSYRPTHITVDRFEVELTNLDSSATYQVVVSSSNAGALGIGGCGTGSQTRTVTGVASQALRFVLYACAVDSGTVTAEVRRTGADTADASAGQPLTVVPIPDAVPAAERAARGAVPRVGTPGIVSGIHFDRVSTTSFRVKWSEPSDGDRDIWSYGILLWTGHVINDKPPYGDATTITSWETLMEDRIEKKAHTPTGLQDDETYHFLMHACNPIGCGHWSYPAKSQTTTTTVTPAPGSPDRPHTIRFTDITATSARVRWSAAANTGGAPLTGFDIKYWPYDPANPNSETGARTQPADDGNDRTEPVTGLAPNTEYEVKMRACNGPNRCSIWSNDHGFRTLADTSMPPPPTATRPAQVARPAVSSRDAALYVSWTAPGAGGSAITHYDVQYRQGTSGPWTPANDVQAPARSTTIRGLTNGQAHQVQVRAVNAVGDGDWSDSAPGTPTTTVTEPGAVRNLTVTPAGSGRLHVSWQAPSRTGGAGITGYKVSWPGRVQSLEPTARRYTIPGLTNGQSYSVGVQACNDPAKTRCGDWTYQSDTPTAGVTRPGPVRSLTVTPGNRQLALRWQAPSSNGGTAITGYEVQYKERISSSWQSWTHSGTGTTATITDRLNGTLYDVRVRACNHGDDDEARCSSRWEYARGTPEAPRPRNLNVVPQARRTAKMTWVEVSGATEYQVAAQVLGESAWHKGKCEGDPSGMPGRVSQLECVIDLEYITKVGTAIGLQDHPAYALRVRAAKPQSSAYSEPVVIIDTPIVTTMGDNSRLEVTWTPVDSMHAELNSGGSYLLRYRKLKDGDMDELGEYISGHTTRTWNPEVEGYDPTQPTPLLPAGSTSHPLRNLQDKGLYAIQLIYDSPRDRSEGVDTGPVKVFAARDAYAWPSDRAAGGGERVGSFPLNRPLQNSNYLPAATYEYRLCEDTFPELEIDLDAGKVGWPTFIRHAFGRWWDATDGLVRIVQKPGPCGNYAPQRPVDQAVTDVQRLMTAGGRPEPDAQVVRSHVEGFLERSRYVSVLRKALLEAAIRDSDDDELVEIEVLSEVFMFESNDNPMIYDFSSDVTIPFCGSFHTMGCAIARTEHPTRGWITDIALRKDDAFRPSSYFIPEIPIITFNKCQVQLTANQQSFAARYAVLVHELGHAYGIRNGRDGREQEIHHPNTEANGIRDTVMEKGTTVCAPTPFDVMAMQALYQTKPRPASNGLDELG